MDGVWLQVREGDKTGLLILRGEAQGLVDSVALHPMLGRTVIRQVEIVAQRLVMSTIL